LFTDVNEFTVTTPKNPHNDLLYAYLSNKKKDVVTKRPCTQLTFSHWSAGESQVVHITPVWHLSITESRLVWSINHNVTQFLPAIRQIASEFICQDKAPAHRALEAINLTHNFAKSPAILKILSNHTQR